MAENKLRQNSPRTQDRDWNETSNRTNDGMRPQHTDNNQDDNDSYLRNTGRQGRQRDSFENRGSYNSDQQYDSQDFRNDWYDQNRNMINRGSSYGGGRGYYGQSYDGGYQANTGYGGNQYAGRNNERGSQGSYGGNYDQGSFGGNFDRGSQGSFGGNFDRGSQGSFGGNFDQGYDQGRFGNYSQFGSRYNQAETLRGNIGREQYGTPESSPWNQGNYPGNQEWDSNRQRQGNDRSMSNYSNNRSRSESSMGINEQGSLYGSGPHKGKGPRGYQRSEERIKEDINDRLSDDGQLDASEIEVEVKDNSVILSGSVDSREAKRRAEDVAESISGVHNVENRLHVNRQNENERKSTSSMNNNQDQRNKKGSLTGATS